MTYRKIAVFAAVLTLLASTAIAGATSFSAVFVYGDSLSDNGNLYARDGGIAPLSPPYYNGRFSNGPVAVEQLATLLGVPLVDYAFGGATTGVGNIGDGGTQTTLGLFSLPGMLTELADFPLPSSLAPTSLFVVWGGADDFGLVTPTTTPSEFNSIVTTAVGDIDTIVATLQADGATHILVPGLPDLALTPEYSGNPATAFAANLYSTEFNAGLQASLPAGVTYFNTYALLNEIEADPSAYGLTNTTTACLNGVMVCSTPSQYLFWDDIHPTTTADAILAQQFYAVTPEPSSILMLGSGIVGLAGLLRRRRAAKASV